VIKNLSAVRNKGISVAIGLSSDFLGHFRKTAPAWKPLRLGWSRQPQSFIEKRDNRKVAADTDALKSVTEERCSPASLPSKTSRPAARRTGLITGNFPNCREPGQKSDPLGQLPGHFLEFSFPWSKAYQKRVAACDQRANAGDNA
jgi:hypothetical protein